MGETGCPLHGGHLMVEEMQPSVPVRPRSNITILWNKKDLREKKEFIDTQSEPTLDGRDEILGEGRNHGISAERIYPGGNSNTGPMPCHGEFLYHARWHEQTCWVSTGGWREYCGRGCLCAQTTGSDSLPKRPGGQEWVAVLPFLRGGCSKHEEDTKVSSTHD